MMNGKYRSIQMLLGLVGMMMVVRVASHDYGGALSKCILFFEGQRSGKLPSTQRMTWRKDSALRDGADVGVSLSLLRWTFNSSIIKHIYNILVNNFR